MLPVKAFDRAVIVIAVLGACSSRVVSGVDLPDAGGTGTGGAVATTGGSSGGPGDFQTGTGCSVCGYGCAQSLPGGGKPCLQDPMGQTMGMSEFAALSTCTEAHCVAPCATFLSECVGIYDATCLACAKAMCANELAACQSH